MLPASRSGEHHRRRRRRCCCVPDLPCPPLIPIPLVQALFADPEQQGVRLRVTATKATGADQEQGGPLLHEEVLDRAAFQARAGGAAVAAPPPPAKQSSRARAAAAYSALKPFVIISLSCEATQRNWGHLLAGVVAAPVCLYIPHHHAPCAPCRPAFHHHRRCCAHGAWPCPR